MTSPDSIAIDRIESARFLFSDHETARRFLEAPKDSHPGIAAEALRRGERYYTGHSARSCRDGSHFDGPLDEVHGEALSVAPNYIARVAAEDVIHRVYLCDDGVSVLTLVESDEGKRVTAASCHVLGADLLARWESLVARFQRRNEVVRGTFVGVLVKTMGGYDIRHCGIEQSELIAANYAADVCAAIHSSLHELTAKEPAGRLLLLEGPPGTGKTRAVRAMIGALGQRARVVIVPPHLIADLAGPDLIGALLGSRSPTVLVIEDADYALLDREHRSDADKQGATGALSAMLNLTDGILGAQIDMRVIATTNARVDHLDAAVLRPGRLLDRVVFGPLDVEQARCAAAHELRGEFERRTVNPEVLRAQIVAPMTLAEVYALAHVARKAGATENDVQAAAEAA